MGKENDLMLDYLRDNRRFADLFNGGLFGGETIINAADLQEGSENYTEYKREITSATVIGKAKVKKKNQTVPRSRDLKKRLGTGAALRILAIEEQSHIDYTMPWRCMNYDSLEYSRQVRDIQKKNQECQPYTDENEKLCRFTRTDRLDPIYTVCLYHGTEQWDGPRNLKDMMNFGQDHANPVLESYFSDYPMHLICVNELEDFSQFSTGLKELFSLMAYRKDKKGMMKFLENHEEYQHLDEETAEVISGMMGVETFMENKEQYEEEGKYNMCQAIRELWNDGWNDGLSEGISQGISQGIEQGISQGISQGIDLSAAIFRAIRSGASDNQSIAELCNCTVEEVEAIRKAFDI